MQVTLKFNTSDFDSFIESVKSEVVNDSLDGVTEAINIAQKELIRISPVKSGDYKKSHRKNVKRVKGVTTGVVESDLPYSEILEQGVRGKVYNYHQGSSVIHRGVGNGTYKRTYDRLQKKLEETVINKLS